MYQDVIDWLNETFDIQVTEMLPGKEGDGTAWPIAETLKHHGFNEPEVTGDVINFYYELDPLFGGRQNISCPDFVSYFIADFDAGKYPELIAHAEAAE